MSAPFTRRALLGATAAAGVAALPSVALAYVPAVSERQTDAALFDLIERHKALDVAWFAADEHKDEVWWRAWHAHPPRPEALRYQSDDFPRTSYAAGVADQADEDGSRWYGARGVEWLRRRNQPASWTAGGELRRREIVEAWDSWTVACAMVDEQFSVGVAREAAQQAYRDVVSCETAIMEHMPVTAAGWKAKVAWLLSQPSPLEPALAFLRQLAGDAAPPVGNEDAVNIEVAT